MARSERKAALRVAVEAGDAVTIRRLVRADQSLLSSGNAHGNNTPLEVALGREDIGTARLLVALGADPALRNHGGFSLLDKATLDGRREAGAFLIECGLPVKVHHAAGLGRVDLLTEILDTSPDRIGLSPMGRKRISPLHVAAWSGAVECVRLLISRGADVDLEDHLGKTPLDYAVRYRRRECVEALLGAGPSITDEAVRRARSNRDRRTQALLSQVLDTD